MNPESKRGKINPTSPEMLIGKSYGVAANRLFGLGVTRFIVGSSTDYPSINLDSGTAFVKVKLDTERADFIVTAIETHITPIQGKVLSLPRSNKQAA